MNMRGQAIKGIFRAWLSLQTQVDDLHRHFIDHLTIPSRQGKGTLRRVDDVFDCWFESGSMPYGQAHYPFENKEFFQVHAAGFHAAPHARHARTSLVMAPLPTLVQSRFQ